MGVGSKPIQNGSKLEVQLGVAVDLFVAGAVLDGGCRDMCLEGWESIIILRE
jgi:hypothetical protein